LHQLGDVRVLLRHIRIAFGVSDEIDVSADQSRRDHRANGDQPDLARSPLRRLFGGLVSRRLIGICHALNSTYSCTARLTRGRPTFVDITAPWQERETSLAVNPS